MIQMIELTDNNGKPRLINLSNVTDIGINVEGQTFICFNGDDAFILVKQSFEEVMFEVATAKNNWYQTYKEVPYPKKQTKEN